ncbi:LysM peptidoglycan-binding domain-containing protein [Brevibacillus massiliensis]|uniref:LysM peptidoglycan-binding domain-containing protein n=1 Tax=Brevibacillus massiliensis TaxID=1118054 RepID=UPI000364864A|nr:LysM peptidoglycan-binding domain-containing protein [Brevibacillus massiliensis]
MEYGVWLSWNNQQEGFQIPINPSSIEMGDGSNSATYDIVGLGEINVIKSPKLTTYAFSSIFPAQNYPFISASVVLQPYEYVDMIKRWMETRRPIRFVFTGASFDINEAVSIESFDWKEVAGGIGDIEYTLKLKKYVFYSAQRVNVTTRQTGTTTTQVIRKGTKPRQNDRQTPKTHTLAPGENLWTVAKKVLGDDSKWREIQRLNGISDAQLKQLPVGMVLKLPGGTANV